LPEAVPHHLAVTRTARFWVLGGEVAAPAETWIVLHGYQQLARRFLRRFEPLADGTRRVVAPEALSRFYTDQAPGRHGPSSEVGASWMTREEREVEIADYVRYLDQLAQEVVSPGTRLTVLGFSQGVATAARWSVLGRTRPQRLVLWGDFLPPDLDPLAAGPAWAGMEVVLVRGERDGVLANPRLAEGEAAWLARAGAEARIVRYAGGHDIDQGTLAALISA
jgi:predicted esterase